jgi:antitoxin component YwqK of YwqJK toxin-antitoxin module
MTPSQQPEDGEHIEYHRDGSVWAKGQKAGGELDGYWEWFRKDGTLMRSGSFVHGKQVGEWITYDKHGAVVKVTRVKDPR